jgi:hypothetical protein
VTVTMFGLDVDAAFELVGCGPGAAPTGRRVRVELAERGRVPRGGRRLAEARGRAGEAAAAVEEVSGGYAIWAAGFGRAFLDSAGGSVWCEPAALPAWRWQRFVVGQVVPFAAALQGLEVLHASAVALEGRGLGVVARSGAGKTSLGLELVLRGAGFLTDDVLALEAADGAVLAHPGAAVANVRRDGSTLAGRLVDASAARVVGEAAEEVRVALRGLDAPLPLADVFYLERTTAGSGAVVERLDPVEPRLLLASTFNLALRDPARLERQLDVCARLAATAAVHRVACPPAVDAAALAPLVQGAVAPAGRAT